MSRVLIVEDDRELRQVLGFALMDLGLECKEAEDGRQALGALCEATASGQAYDCVVLDIIMPGGMDGWAVLEAIRSNTLWADMSVIVLSGRATLAAEKERAARLGACHIEKRARFIDEVAEKVAQLLGLAQAEEQ